MFGARSKHANLRGAARIEERDTPMTLKTLLYGTVAFLAVAAFAGTKAAQTASAAGPQQAPQNQNPPTIVQRTTTVIVPVTVKDDHGQLVAGLTRDDFRIFADDVEQKIFSFSADPVPLSAVVLIDDDLSQRVAAQVQKSLATISAGFGPDDEVALVTFDQFPQTVSDLSTDNDALYTKLKRLEIGAHSDQVIADPTTAGPLINGQPAPSSTGIQVHGSQRYKKDNALHDAIFSAGQILKDQNRNRRKIIFLISDGNNAGRNEHTFEQTLHLLLESDISVYSISVVHTTPVGKALVQRGESFLDKYASATGGDTFYAGKDNELERLYSSVTEQARNEYTLTFSPDDVPAGQDFHPIEVRVKRPGLSIETRSGYYASAIAAGH